MTSEVSQAYARRQRDGLANEFGSYGRLRHLTGRGAHSPLGLCVHERRQARAAEP